MELNGVRLPDGYNGVGLHDTPGAWTAAWDYDQAKAHGLALRERGVTAYKLFVSGANKTERARGYVDAGLLVAVRMYTLEPWGPPIRIAPDDQVQPYCDVGVQLVEQTNEFNIACEWKDGAIPYSPTTIAVKVVDVWEKLLSQAANVDGMVPLFPSNTPGGNVDHRLCYQAIAAELDNRGLRESVEHAAIHPRPLNNPPDAVWTATNTCTFDEWRWIRDTLQPSAYYWATEHGYSLGDAQNHNYPMIDLAKHTDYNWALWRRLDPAHADAIGLHFAGTFHWFHAGYGHWGAWAKDAIEDSPAAEMPAPSPLWVRMGVQNLQLDFSRYTQEPPPEPPPEPPALGIEHLEDVLDWKLDGDGHPIKYGTRDPWSINAMVVHHTAVEPKQDDYWYSVRHIEAINRYHIETNEWPRIGYHFCIDRLGRIFQVNHVEHISYHAAGHNSRSVGVALFGALHQHEPTQAQLEALRWLRELSGLPAVAHGELCDTECPGLWWDDWKAWVNGEPPPEPEPEPVGVTFTHAAIGSLVILKGDHPEPGSILQLTNAQPPGYTWHTQAGTKPEYGDGGFEFSVPDEGDYWLMHDDAWVYVKLQRGITTAEYSA